MSKPSNALTDLSTWSRLDEGSVASIKLSARSPSVKNTSRNSPLTISASMRSGNLSCSHPESVLRCKLMDEESRLHSLPSGVSRAVRMTRYNSGWRMTVPRRVLRVLLNSKSTSAEGESRRFCPATRLRHTSPTQPPKQSRLAAFVFRPYDSQRLVGVCRKIDFDVAQQAEVPETSSQDLHATVSSSQSGPSANHLPARSHRSSTCCWMFCRCSR